MINWNTVWQCVPVQVNVVLWAFHSTCLMVKYRRLFTWFFQTRKKKKTLQITQAFKQATENKISIKATETGSILNDCKHHTKVIFYKCICSYMFFICRIIWKHFIGKDEKVMRGNIRSVSWIWEKSDKSLIKSPAHIHWCRTGINTFWHFIVHSLTWQNRLLLQSSEAWFKNFTTYSKPKDLI